MTRSAYQEATALWFEQALASRDLPETREWMSRRSTYASICASARPNRRVRLVARTPPRSGGLAQASATTPTRRVCDFMSNTITTARRRTGDGDRLACAGDRRTELGGPEPTHCRELSSRQTLTSPWASTTSGSVGRAETWSARLPTRVGERFGLAAPPSILIAELGWSLCVAELGDFADGTRYASETIRIARGKQSAYLDRLSLLGERRTASPSWATSTCHASRSNVGLRSCRDAFLSLPWTSPSPWVMRMPCGAGRGSLPLLEQAEELGRRPAG